MHVEATTESPLATDADAIAFGVFEGEQAPRDVAGEDIQRLLDRGEAGGALEHLAITHCDDRRLIVVGLGRRSEFGAERARLVAATAHGRAHQLGARVLCWRVPQEVGEDVPSALVEGTLLHAYRFDRYKPDRPGRAIQRLLVSADSEVEQRVREAAIITTAQNRARDLGNTPSNDLPPAALADHAAQLADRHPAISVTALGEAEIRAAGMGAFAAVAQGSAQEARLIRIDYEGPRSDEEPQRLAMVGKGVTFDSGGLSLKSSRDMHDMKFDMCGAAAVIEAIGALAELRVPGSVLGLVGAAENLPSGRAVKPGDIVRALDGTTIEVNNTDAEGRLILADCLAYARREGCSHLVDIATLTGGVVVALGSIYAGLMANQDAWAAHVQAAAERAGEPVWRLPLHPDYARMVKGRYAQLTNRSERREAMAITAAELLHHFAGDVPWAHLDIAGTAWDVPRRYFAGHGATGFGVRMLVELARSRAPAAN